jgi:hypothetical protein
MMYFETKNAAKLKSAAHNTAWKGVSTLVETIVAMELAASLKPFIKTNINASIIITTIKAINCFTRI